MCDRFRRVWAILSIVLSITAQSSGRTLRSTRFADVFDAIEPALIQDDAAVYSSNSWRTLPSDEGYTKRNNDASIFLQHQPDGKYLYVSPSGDVLEADKTKCMNEGKFIHRIATNKFESLQHFATKKYLAINSTGRLYTTNQLSDDADLHLENDKTLPARQYRIYRKTKDGQKLYFSLSTPNKVSKNDADIFKLRLTCI